MKNTSLELLGVFPFDNAPGTPSPMQVRPPLAYGQSVPLALERYVQAPRSLRPPAEQIAVPAVPTRESILPYRTTSVLKTPTFTPRAAPQLPMGPPAAPRGVLPGVPASVSPRYRAPGYASCAPGDQYVSIVAPSSPRRSADAAPTPAFEVPCNTVSVPDGLGPPLRSRVSKWSTLRSQGFAGTPDDSVFKGYGSNPRGSLYGMGALGTASVKSPGKDCPATGSWENYCDCMFDAGTSQNKACRSSWPFAPWTIVGKLIGQGGGVPVITPSGGGGSTTVDVTPSGGSGSSAPPVTPTEGSSWSKPVLIGAAIAAAAGAGYLLLRKRRGGAVAGLFRHRRRR